ncbi:MAG: hypothetical protein IH586_03305, partial [Anaerolineaceae bacterium]|nr:hypothetical protein [Anaerolineaceae bacterium]
MRFCGMCGAALTFTCSECQFVNPVSYRFCGMCGSPLMPNGYSGRGSVSPHAVHY